MSRPLPPRRIALLLPLLVALLGCFDAEPPVPSSAAVVPPADGGPVPSAVLDAGPLAAPQAIAFDPPLGATAVDPARTTLVVTFDREMDAEGWAWVVESPVTAPEIGDSSWDPARRVQTAQVTLAPGRSYVVWLNSAAHPYFRDRAGQSLEPVRWTFSTAPAGVPTGAVPTLSAHEPRRPTG